MAARLLANENVPRPAIIALREAGHDVLWMLEDARGMVDSEVLARAQREHRVVTTFDKDFGELAFRDGAAATVGVVLFRITMTSRIASLGWQLRSSPNARTGGGFLR